MSWFSTLLLGLSRIYADGVSVARRGGVNFKGNVTVTGNDTLDAYDIEFPDIPFGTQDAAVAGNIASGSVTIASDRIVLTAETGTADTLSTISTTLPVGAVVVLTAASGHTIALDNSDNIITQSLTLSGNIAAWVQQVATDVWQVISVNASGDVFAERLFLEYPGSIWGRDYGGSNRALVSVDDATGKVSFGNATTMRTSGETVVNAPDWVTVAIGGTDCWWFDDADGFYPATDNAWAVGTVTERPTQICAIAGTINTSDIREKQDVTVVGPAPVPTLGETTGDDVLDAWAEVSWVFYRWIDQVAEKAQQGIEARVHVGVIAQHIEQVFADRGLDAFRLGLLCYDEWDDKVRVDQQAAKEQWLALKEKHKNNPTHPELRDWVPPTKLRTPAGNRYGVRYGEAFALEAALQRRERARAEQRADAVEQRLANVEAQLQNLIGDGK